MCERAGCGWDGLEVHKDEVKTSLKQVHSDEIETPMKQHTIYAVVDA